MFKIIEMSFVIPRDQSVSELSSFSKLFDHAVLYNIIPASPTAVLHLKATTTEKIERKDRLESKFLDSREVKVLFTELAQRRNPAL